MNSSNNDNSKKNLTEEQYNTIQIKKGIALYDISDIEAADSLYRRISTKSPHSIDYHYFAACYFYYSNNFKKALPHLLKCFEEGNAKMKLDASEMLASIYFLLHLPLRCHDVNLIRLTFRRSLVVQRIEISLVGRLKYCPDFIEPFIR